MTYGYCIGKADNPYLLTLKFGKHFVTFEIEFKQILLCFFKFSLKCHKMFIKLHSSK